MTQNLISFFNSKFLFILGLKPKGLNPQIGQGANVDPVTGIQRILSHPQGKNPHAHVNDINGVRIGINGKNVPKESPEAHLPIREEFF